MLILDMFIRYISQCRILSPPQKQQVIGAIMSGRRYFVIELLDVINEFMRRTNRQPISDPNDILILKQMVHDMIQNREANKNVISKSG